MNLRLSLFFLGWGDVDISKSLMWHKILLNVFVVSLNDLLLLLELSLAQCRSWIGDDSELF